MASNTSVEQALFIDHIQSEMDLMLRNVTEDLKAVNDMVFYPKQVKEPTSVFSIPYDSPLPSRIDGQIVEEGLKQASYTAKIHPVGMSVKWGVEEDDFNMAKMSLTTQAQNVAQHFANLHWYFTAELLEGTAGSAGARWYDNIPTCWDGTALFSSSARFGYSAGNLLSSAASAAAHTVQDLADDYKAGLKAFSSYEFPRNGNKMWKIGSNTRILWMIPGEMVDVVEEFLNSKLIVRGLGVAGTATDFVGGAATNPWPLPRFEYKIVDQLSGTNDYYMVISDSRFPATKPFISLTKSGYGAYKMTPYLEPQDYRLRMDRNRAVVFETYAGVVPMAPQAIVKFNNAN